MKIYNKITSMYSNHVPKQFKREKMVSSSLDDFKLLFMSSDVRFLYTFGGRKLMRTAY